METMASRFGWTASVEHRFAGHVQFRQHGCWEWSGRTVPTRKKNGERRSGGYGIFNHGEKKLPAHRTAYSMWVGKIPSGAFVLHRCDNRKCVRPEHLYLGNHRQNMRDAVERNRMRGERNGSARLTEDQVRDIRIRCRAGVSQRRIAAEYGIRQQTVSMIVTRTNWSHVQ